MSSLIELLTFGAIQFSVVRQGEVRVIEKRGKFIRIAPPGVAVLFALWGWGEKIGRFQISSLKRGSDGKVEVVSRGLTEVIPTRMQVDDYPKESVITRDNATVFIDAVVYYRIVDAHKAVYEVQDYVSALQKLVQSALRDECGKYELDSLLTSRDQINTRLRLVLDEATDPWGIKVDRVEIKDIDLGQFGQILAEQRAAETRRRTDITEAEGKKRAAILRAEGQAESSITAAKGEKEATILRAEASKASAILNAEAQAEALLKMRQAEARGLQLLTQVFANNDSSQDVLRMIQLQQASEVGRALANGQATKLILPGDVASLFGMAERFLDRKEA
ncbi:MAG: paraslipin [Deltaproteobacteria bacterium]|nr:paraslipin [Deltaproteobacteria bacterium]